jgi:hypothetical protein
MNIPSVEFYDEKTQSIKTANWGVINSVLVSIYLLANSQNINEVDYVYQTVIAFVYVLFPLFLLKFSIQYRQRFIVIIYKLLSLCHVLSCFLRAFVFMAVIYESNTICGHCLSSTNTTCMINYNKTIVEIDRVDCQDLLLNNMFFIFINLFMIVATLQTLNGLKLIIKNKQLPNVIAKNMDVPDIEHISDLEENKYVPPQNLKEKVISSEIIQINEEIEEENEERTITHTI